MALTSILVVLCVVILVFSFFPSRNYSITVANHTSTVSRVQGIVSREVERRIDGQQIVLSDIKVADETVVGKLLVHAPLFPRIEYGDTIIFSCKLEKPEPFDGFAYDRYLESRGIFAVCQFPQFITTIKDDSPSLINVLLFSKQKIVERLGFLFGEPHGSFVSGLLFGGSASLSDDLREDFSRTGLSHILAASGVNVSLFSVLLLRWLLQSPLGKRRGLITASVLLILYVIMAGATPAVVRAGIMAGLLIIQRGIGRQAQMTNVILLTLTLMLLLNSRLLFNVGFQLSFVATAALLFFHPFVEKQFEFIPDVIGIRTAISSSFVAIVFTLPILLWNFGQISLVAPLTNALILPFVPYLMSAALIAFLASLLYLPLGQIVALPVIAVSYIVLQLVTIFGSLSFASVSVAFSHSLAVFSAAAIGILTFYKCNRIKNC